MIGTLRTGAPLASAVALLFVPAHACAAVQNSQVWGQVNVIVPLTRQLRFTLEQVARYGQDQGGHYQNELGGLLGLRVSKAVEFGFGYRWVRSLDDDKANDEHRLRQQIVFTSGRISTRLRVDERFKPGSDEIGFRIRPLLRYNQPLGPKGVSAFVSHESFFLPNSTKWGQESGYERMRNIVGITFPISKALSADVGYLNQYRFARGASPAEMDHVLNMQLTINFGAFTAPLLHD